MARLFTREQIDTARREGKFLASIVIAGKNGRPIFTWTAPLDNKYQGRFYALHNSIMNEVNGVTEPLPAVPPSEPPKSGVGTKGG